MDLIRFVGTSTIIHADLAFSEGRIVMTPSVMPTDEELGLGFEVINEHNGIVQGDYSEYKHIYQKGAKTVVLTTESDDSYVAPTYAKILYIAADGGSVSLASETVQTNADSIAVEGSTATPLDGYQFVNWTDMSGAEVSTTAKFVPEITAESVDATYAANFKAIPVPEKTIEEVREAKKAEINSAYDAALNAGTSATLADKSLISFSVNQDLINDASAAFNLASALYGTEGITVPFEINKVCYQYSPLDVIYIYIAMQIYIVACKSLRNELLGTVDRAKTKKAINAITFEKDSLDETGLEGYEASMTSGENMIAAMKQKFGIDTVTADTAEVTTEE